MKLIEICRRLLQRPATLAQIPLLCVRLSCPLCQPLSKPVTAANCQSKFLINSRSGNNIMSEHEIKFGNQPLDHKVLEQLYSNTIRLIKTGKLSKNFVDQSLSLQQVLLQKFLLNVPQQDEILKGEFPKCQNTIPDLSLSH